MVTGWPCACPEPDIVMVELPASRRLRAPAYVSNAASAAYEVLACTDTATPGLPVSVLAVLSVQCSPGLAPVSGRCGKKLRKPDRSWPRFLAIVVSDGVPFLNSPRAVRRPL